MCSATSLLPPPEATKRHKHQAASVSSSEPSTRLHAKPEAAAVLDDQRNTNEGHKPADTANRRGDIKPLNNEKHLPSLSIPSRPYIPLPRNGVGCVQNNGGRVDGHADGVLYGSEDPPSHSTDYHCGSDVEKQLEQSYGVYWEGGYGLPVSHPDTAAMSTSIKLKENEHDIDQHLKSILVSPPARFRSNRANPSPNQLHLSIISPFLTLALSVYAFASLALLSIIHPLRYCTSHPPLHQQIAHALRPQIDWQLRLIHSNHSHHSPSPSAHTRMLLFVSLFSPVYAVGIASASWVAAVFWFYSAILGEPQGGNRLENDGRAAVRGVRRWWERWLVRGAGL
ncbi:hypothetical protein MMC34_000167 [Xylographa carneopallida]|nr:hypothetical protein [Xylographa carneopallida]